MTRSRTSSATSSSATQENKADTTDARPIKMNRTVSFNTLPETELDLSKTVPQSRRVSKSKTCTSFMPQNQQQGDVELATSIGHDLLLEVKKMQGLLQEKNDSLTTVSLEKADAQQEVDQLTKQLKQCTESLELGREQIWNLELEKQELAQQVDDLQQQAKRNEVDQAKLTDQESDLKQELEQLKQQQMTWQEAMEQSNQDKVDLAITRRKLAALQRQVSSNKAMVDASRVSFAGGFQSPYQADTFRFSLPPDPQLNFPHLTASESESSPSSSIPAVDTAATCSTSIAKNVRQQQRQQQDEIITINTELQASLQTANNTIQVLQHSLENEQKKRAEMELLWRDAQQVIENKTGDDDNNPLPLPSSSPLMDDQQHDFDNTLLADLDKLHGKKPHTLAQLNRRIFKKDTRHNRQKCLSLGDELSLAGPGGLLPQFNSFDLDLTKTNDDRVLESSKMISTSSFSSSPATTTTKKWLSETLDNQTNLYDIIAMNAAIDLPSSPMTASLSHLFRGNGDKRGDHFTKFGNSDMGSRAIADSHHKGNFRNDNKQVYGSILATESYIYQASHRSRLSPSPPSSHMEEKDTSSNSSSQGIEKNMTEGKSKLTSSNSNSDGKRCIRALTRTMIGDWMWKYTRKVVGNGISENRHKRFFWLHPYSKTLYWSTQEPGTDGCEHNTKCVMIESFMVIDDGHVTSFYIQTSGRGIKIQCTDEVTHRDWFKSLKYLLIDIPPLTPPPSTQQQQQPLDSNSTTNKTMQQLKMNQQRLTKLLRYHPPNMTTRATRSVARLRPDCQHAFATMSPTSPTSRQASHHLDSTLSALAAVTSSSSSNNIPSLLPPLTTQRTSQSPLTSPPLIATFDDDHKNETPGNSNHRFGSLTPVFMKLTSSRREF